MPEIWSTIVAELTERATGPMALRLFIQPAVASALAIRSGLRDARTGRPPYFWSIVSDPSHRAELLRDGWKTIGKVFVLVLVLDIFYQLIIGAPLLIRQSLILAVILAVLPYLLLRGAVTRIVRAFRGSA